jgi:uncharacterized protein (TIGR04206 family)
VTRTDGTRAFAARFALLLVPLFVPWSVLTGDATRPTFLFAWGLVNPDPLAVTTLYDFLFRYTAGLPDYILAWPLSVACYVSAVASALVGRYAGTRAERAGRDGRGGRVTAGLLALAGIAQLSLAYGFSVQPGRTAWPVGTAVLWAVAGYVYVSTATRRQSPPARASGR